MQGPLSYTFVYVIPALVVVTLLAGGWWLLVTPAVVFGLIPLLELGMKGSTRNYDPDEEAARRASKLFDLVIYAAVPVQLAVLGVFMSLVSSGVLQGWELLGGIASTAISCGGLAINVGHELGHRKGAFQQRLAKLMLMTSLYSHFFIEHNRGHHSRLGTDADPASSRKGESLYTYWFRSSVLGWVSAWELEAKRLSRRKRRVVSFQNEMLRLQLYQALAVLSAGLVFGWLAAAAWVAAALSGGLILETVNYIEHYGLRRETNARGRLEPVRPVHSWNSNHPLGRLLLFDLSRHSDHHANPKRPYQVLRHFDEAPSLPTGYPGMMVLASVPPLFKSVMARRLERWHASQAA